MSFSIIRHFFLFVSSGNGVGNFFLLKNSLPLSFMFICDVILFIAFFNATSTAALPPFTASSAYLKLSSSISPYFPPSPSLAFAMTSLCSVVYLAFILTCIPTESLTFIVEVFIIKTPMALFASPEYCIALFAQSFLHVV